MNSTNNQTEIMMNNLIDEINTTDINISDYDKKTVNINAFNIKLTDAKIKKINNTFAEYIKNETNELFTFNKDNLLNYINYLFCACYSFSSASNFLNDENYYRLNEYSNFIIMYVKCYLKITVMNMKLTKQELFYLFGYKKSLWMIYFNPDNKQEKINEFLSFFSRQEGFNFTDLRIKFICMNTNTSHIVKFIGHNYSNLNIPIIQHQEYKLKCLNMPLNLINEMYENSPEDIECPVCLDKIEKTELKITFCGHKYCEKCLKRLNKCAICLRE